jgi:hypothetical protein
VLRRAQVAFLLQQWTTMLGRDRSAYIKAHVAAVAAARPAWRDEAAAYLASARTRLATLAADVRAPGTHHHHLYYTHRHAHRCIHAQMLKRGGAVSRV